MEGWSDGDGGMVDGSGFANDGVKTVKTVKMVKSGFMRNGGWWMVDRSGLNNHRQRRLCHRGTMRDLMNGRAAPKRIRDKKRVPPNSPRAWRRAVPQ